MATHSTSVTFGDKTDSEVMANTNAEDIEHEKLTEWKNEPKIMDLEDDFNASKPHHDEMASKITEWLSLINITGSAKPKVVGRNRSSIQPKLIRRQGEWRYSALTESFLSAEKLFSVEPRTFEDEPSATQNQHLLNYQFNTKLNKVKFIDDYVRTTYDEGTAFIKVGWYRRTHKEQVEEPIYSYFPIQNPQDMQIYEQLVALKAENPRGFEEQIPAEYQAAIAYSEEQGVPCVAIDTGEVEVIEEEIIDENHPTADILDYNNLYFDPTCEGDLTKANFAIITFETNKAELQADGRYKNLDKVSYSGNTPLTVPDHQMKHGSDFNFKDDARKRVIAKEYWGSYDIEGDGVLVPIVATYIGRTIIRMEKNPFPDQKLPIVAVPYMPVRKQVHGETDAELLKDNQAVIGAVKRGLIDSIGRTANGQRGFAKNMLDVGNRRKFENGEDYEYNPGSNPKEGMIEHKFGEISQSALAIMQMENQEAESLTGVKAFTGGLSSDAYGKVAAGIRGMLDASAKREMGILRRLAQGLVLVGQKWISMNAVFLSEEEVIRITNREYVVIKREDLKGNFDLIVDISTPEIDEAKSNDLNFMLQTNGNNMEPEMRNMLLADIADLKKMPVLAEKIRTFVPTPDPLQEQMKQLEIQRLQLENQKLQAEIMEIQTRAGVNQAKAAEVSATKDLKDLEFVEQESGTKHAREMQKTSQQAKANQSLEVTKALLKGRKPEEIPGNIDAAIGYNEITKIADDPLMS